MNKLTATLCLPLAVLVGSEARGADLPVCEGSPKTITSNAEIAEWDNCRGTAVVARSPKVSGDKYVGEWKDGVQHGQGTYTKSNGN